jgi:hypothetical protein
MNEGSKFMAGDKKSFISEEICCWTLKVLIGSSSCVPLAIANEERFLIRPKA